jgi:hypothetical protein
MSHTSIGKYLLVAALLTLGIGASHALAAEDITGDWAVTVEMEGFGQMQGTLTFEKKADGTLTGMWGSSALSNVKFENDQLAFTRALQTPGGDMTQTFKGTVKDGKLTGALSGDQGESKVAGAKKKPLSPAVGVWDLKYNAGGQDMTAKLTISQKPDGALDGRWESQMGQSVVSNVKFADGKLTLDRAMKMDDQEMKMTFAGAIQGDKLTGTVKSEMGDIAVTGTRANADLIGKWEMTSVSDMGTMRSLMTINPDLTGTYDFFFNEMPMKNVKFENGQLTFAIEMRFGEQSFPMDFKGKVEGKTIKGKLTTGQGTNEVTGKKLEAAAPTAQPATPAAASAAPAAAGARAGSAPAAGIVGTWEFTRQGRDGTPQVSTLKINSDMTGTYTMRDTPSPVKDLKVTGNEVTFKVTMSFGGNEMTQDFKGTMEGQTLNGAFTSERGSREATGKKVP